MFGWVGELANAFGKLGFEGMVLLTLLLVIFMLVRANTAKSKHMLKMHESTLAGLQHSSDSHLAVAKVLSRIEAILGLPPETTDDAS